MVSFSNISNGPETLVKAMRSALQLSMVQPDYSIAKNIGQVMVRIDLAIKAKHYHEVIAIFERTTELYSELLLPGHLYIAMLYNMM